MKSPLSLVIAAGLIIALLAFEFWQFRDQQRYRVATQARIDALTDEVSALEKSLDEANAKLDAVESASLSGIIDNANEALLDGWSAMVETVEKELQRARETFAKPEPRDAAPSRPAPQSVPGEGEGPL